jgi:RNA polymerase sigma factor (sigma-70 family)
VDVQREFASLMQRVREGSQDAARELAEVYGPHIFRVVRRRLNKKLRTKFDSSDFVQSVWASFFAVQPTVASFETPEALIGYLVAIARNKIVDEIRQRQVSVKRNINRERSLDGSAALQVEALEARQPTPSQIAVAKEQWEGWLEKLPSHHQVVLHLLRQGNSQREIAAKLGLDTKTVRRVIQKIAPEYTLHEPEQAPSA